MSWTFTIVLLLALAGFGGYQLMAGGRENQLFLSIKIAFSFFMIIAMKYLSGLGAMSLLAILPAILLALAWAGSLGEFLGGGMSGLLTGGRQEIEPKAFYSIAESRRMKGDLDGALCEINEQLEKFPGDFDGQMLRASIQMENQRDLAAAQITIEVLIAQDHHPRGKIAYALTTLADWHLKYERDQTAARKVFESIMKRFPGTGVELRAAQRVARMDATFDAHDRRDTGSLVSDCLKHLEQHPLDNLTRETLAQIYQDRYGRPDLAMEELNKLIAIPFQTRKDISRWMNLAADWHIKGGDVATARKCLMGITKRMPDTVHSEKAQQRLARMRDAKST